MASTPPANRSTAVNGDTTPRAPISKSKTTEWSENYSPRSSVTSTHSPITLTKSISSSNSRESSTYSSMRKSTITPRNTTFVTRSQAPMSQGSRSGTGGVTYQRTVEITSGLAPASYTNMANADALGLMQDREQEKKDLQDLNTRLANYIERVRFLEAQNRKLAKELEVLRETWSRESTKIKEMYETELRDARDLIDKTEREKAEMEIRCRSMDDEMNDIKRKYDEMSRTNTRDRETIAGQHQQLSDYEAELNLLRRRMTTMEDDRERDRKEVTRLQQEVMKLKFDLDAETLNHIDAENRRQTLEEEIEFLKSTHEQEIKELTALAYKDTTPENREYWRNEMATALRDIQEEYDLRLSSMKSEYETYYNMKVSEIRTANSRVGMETGQLKDDMKKLRVQLSEMRSREADLDGRNIMMEKELQALRRDMDDQEREFDRERADTMMRNKELEDALAALSKQMSDINDKKLSLELEIAAYRRLLEGEEKSLNSVIDNYGSSLADDRYSTRSDTMNQVVKGEMQAKTTLQRSAKGPIQVAEASPEGKFVSLENTGKKEEVIEGWVVKRKIDGKTDIVYTLPRLAINPGKTKVVKIWAKGLSPGGPQDFQSDIDTWGVGSNIYTALTNEKGDEKASLNQKTVYSS